MLIFDLCRLGLNIPDGAIEEMKARLEVTDEDLAVAAAEEKIVCTGAEINFNFALKTLKFCA